MVDEDLQILILRLDHNINKVLHYGLRRLFVERIHIF